MIPIRVIRRRIRSIQNTAKITKAMEMIAASKMRQAQNRVIAGRPYSEKMRDVVAHLADQSQPGEELHPLLQHREVKRIAVVHVTADRGLCGGLNSNVNRMTASFISEQNVPVTSIAVGKKGVTLIDDYISGLIDEVHIAYNKFVSTVNQEPVIQRLLPIAPPTAQDSAAVDYIYEPSAPGVLEHLLPRYVEMRVYHAILESIASEQSARMVAMRNATDNAKEMGDELTLVLNKARQELITKELLDIAGGVVED